MGDESARVMTPKHIQGLIIRGFALIGINIAPSKGARDSALGPPIRFLGKSDGKGNDGGRSKQAEKSRAPPLSNPHVSLIYKQLSPRAKSELASAIKFPFPGVVFDCIKAIRCSAPARTRADVEGWKVVARRSLQ